MANSDTSVQSATGQTGNKKSILLIEDDPFLVGIYKEKFQTEGFDILVAEDGLKGLDFAINRKIDLIILDILIPKLSGVDLLVRLKQDEKAKNIPVIALTNLSDFKDEEKVRSYGVKEYLMKSNYTPSQVVEIVRKYLP